MELTKVHAFYVNPARTLMGDLPPEGGEIEITSSLEAAIFSNISKADFNKQISVDFDLDPDTRTNDIRELILTYAFQDSDEANQAAFNLSSALSNAMDLRSKPNLFILSLFTDGEDKQIILWIFPRDEAFKFDFGNGEVSLQVLNDVFSQTSNLRKAVLFKGRNIKTHFLTGRILDFQSRNKNLKIADFWRVNFLHCRFSIADDAGSRLLVNALRETIDKTKTSAGKEQVFAAILSLKNTPQNRWTLKQVADNYLQDETKNIFLDNIQNEETLYSSFNINKSVLEKLLKYRLFFLSSGVVISSPIDEIKNSVQINHDGDGFVKCEGQILDQKVRTRYG